MQVQAKQNLSTDRESGYDAPTLAEQLLPTDGFWEIEIQFSLRVWLWETEHTLVDSHTAKNTEAAQIVLGKLVLCVVVVFKGTELGEQRSESRSGRSWGKGEGVNKIQNTLNKTLKLIKKNIS